MADQVADDNIYL